MAIYDGITPDLAQFCELAVNRRVIPVRLKVLADSETPVGIYRKLTGSRAGTFLMESAAVGGAWSRYSFIGVHSRATLTSDDGQACWIGEPPVGAPTSGDTMEALRGTIDALATERFENVPPFTSGMVGFIGWDSVRHWEKLPSPPEDDLHLPELAMNLVSDVAIHDNSDGSVMLVANAINYDNSPHRVDEAWHDAVSRLHSMLDRLHSPGNGDIVCPPTALLSPEKLMSEVRQSWDHAAFMRAIDTCKEAIVDGEVFQIVISRRFELSCDAPPLDVYRMLRSSNPSPYMYLFNFEDRAGAPYAVVGSSPEALVTVAGNDVSMHPIAGSRPRSRHAEADRDMAEELLTDTKERSEHLMLVDLARNDISRVCVPGSVEVSQFMEVERFSHIMHLVSTVNGEMSPACSAFDVLAATFPAGTLSGAPKPRALQLLDELEPHRRSVYGGVVGYFDFAGDMDVAIAIRSALLKDRTAFIQAGAGIVADSDPESEAAETLSKAAAPLRAAYFAHQRALSKADGTAQTETL
ncbi:anthranilate synthase component I [Arthrobacter roseus]|uniref:anthranilate synthase component I n=1 Tax=Arthrobacter roseus TaxID=136274 RepID=UPI001962FEBA|nr:anthranilate synthase component I [Arthrobacter roseus]MBM7848426.1 anthranilate synthase component 1 [Arthrobacter roseus]